MEIAYHNTKERSNSNSLRIGLGDGLLGGNYGGETTPLTAGVYTFETDVNIVTDIYFDGGAEEASIFIIQTSKSLLQATDTTVHLTNGAQAKNIFWQVAGKVTVGTYAHMEGILLSKTRVTLMTGSSLNGRIFAQTDCVLQMATIGIRDYSHDSTSEGPSLAPSHSSAPSTSAAPSLAPSL
jgi:hypothetical protein